MNDCRVSEEGFESSQAVVSGEGFRVVLVGRRAMEVTFSKL